MTGQLEPYPFVLAERLGMTVAELDERMPLDEFYRWAAFDTWRAAQQELASKTRGR